MNEIRISLSLDDIYDIQAAFRFREEAEECAFGPDPNLTSKLEVAARVLRGDYDKKPRKVKP